MDLGTIKSFGMFQIAWGYILNWLTLMSLAIKINYIYLYVYLSSMDSSFLWSAQQKNQRKFVSTNIDESSSMHKANIEGLRLLVHLGYSGQGVSCKTKINVFQLNLNKGVYFYKFLWIFFFVPKFLLSFLASYTLQRLVIKYLMPFWIITCMSRQWSTCSLSCDPQCWLTFMIDHRVNKT